MTCSIFFRSDLTSWYHNTNIWLFRNFAWKCHDIWIMWSFFVRCMLLCFFYFFGKGIFYLKIFYSVIVPTRMSCWTFLLTSSQEAPSHSANIVCINTLVSVENATHNIQAIRLRKKYRETCVFSWHGKFILFFFLGWMIHISSGWIYNLFV